MNIILWVVVVPSVASVLIWFLIEFIRLSRRGYQQHRAPREESPGEEGHQEPPADEDEPPAGGPGGEAG